MTPDDRRPARFLPADSRSVLTLAARSMFDLFAQASMGMLVVDREHRVVWISEGYKRFLPALGTDESHFLGRRVEEVVPNTLMAQVVDSGQPILVDLLTNSAGTFLVSRLPLRDESGEVIGAVGMVWMDHPESNMQPLIGKFARLQRELDTARAQLAAQRRPKHTVASFIGSSARAMEVKRQARRVAAADGTVLLLGETGTGKELLAHAIHAAGPRADRPFIGVNIAAVPDALLEAEFFGVAPGAYTGAERRGRDGKFKLADGGTLFLDEIGDMPLALQSKLLRVLQEQEVEPLGSNRVERVDVRVIAATSHDLAARVAEGAFRADLFYRLNVLPIRLPALRERLEDLDALCEALLEDIARRAHRPAKSLAADAMAVLAAHDWPGNIRELRNALEQADLMSDEQVLGAAQLQGLTRPFPSPHPRAELAPAPAERPTAPPAGTEPAAPAAPTGTTAPTADLGGRSLPEAIAALEAAAIRAALQASGGNKVAAARRLGISRATLYEKLAGLADGR